MKTSLFSRSSFFLAASAAMLLCDAARAQQAIWSQAWDVQAQVGPSSRTTRAPLIDREVADDFDVVGIVQEVYAQGEYITYFNGPALNFASAYVRFYASENGTPGALQSEQQIAGSAMTVTNDTSLGIFTMRIPLPQPFVASGRHFISVQTVSDLGWYWRTASNGKPRFSPAKVREHNLVGAWTNANGSSDVAFVLYGTLTGAPQLGSLSDTTRTRSGRLRIFGTNLGANAAPGRTIRIGGLPAIVTSWSNTEIHAYVPEALPPGNYNVQVVTDTGSSNALPLTVTNRTSPGGHARWRFQADSLSITSDAVVAPDGTVYVMDDDGNLYALTPDGGLLWATKSGFQGSKLTRGFDGTLYTMADGILRATNPDGTHKWDFGGANWTISGPTVGPDGNIYGTTQLGPYGFFSVTPEGQLRWSHPEVVDRIPRDHDIVFSAGNAYINHRINPEAGHGLIAYRMNDGAFQWRQDADNPSQPLIGPQGRVYVDWLFGVWYARVIAPDGSVVAQPQIELGSRRFNPDKTRLYATVPSRAYVSALNPETLNPFWSFDTGASVVGPPTPDPFDRFVVSRLSTPGSPGSILALTSGGAFLWEDTLPAENNGNIILTSDPVFSPDGNVAYAGSAIPAYIHPDEYSYLYAFAVAPTGPTPVSAVSRKVHGTAGTFDIPLPLSGTPGIECRQGGANGDYQLVVSFARPVTMSRAAIVRGSGKISSYTVNGAQVTLQLTGATAAGRMNIALEGVNDGASTGIVDLPLALLVGDFNGDGNVNASDILQVRNRSGQITAAGNFRADSNADGNLNAADVSIARGHSGQSLP